MAGSFALYCCEELKGKDEWIRRGRVKSMIINNLCSIFLYVYSRAMVCWPAEISSKFIGGSIINRLIKYTNYEANGKGDIAVGSVLNFSQIIT